MHRRLNHAASRKKAYASRVDNLAALNHHLVGFSLLARFAHVRSKLGRLDESNPAAWLAIARNHLHDLVLHHGVHRIGDGGASHDAHALPIPNGTVERVARRHFGDDVKLHRFWARIDKFGGPNREAVHSRMRERGKCRCRFSN